MFLLALGNQIGKGCRGKTWAKKFHSKVRRRWKKWHWYTTKCLPTLSLSLLGFGESGCMFSWFVWHISATFSISSLPTMQFLCLSLSSKYLSYLTPQNQQKHYTKLWCISATFSVSSLPTMKFLCSSLSSKNLSYLIPQNQQKHCTKPLFHQMCCINTCTTTLSVSSS